MRWACRQRACRCRPVYVDGQIGPDEVLARVFGLFESLISLAVGLGALVASLLIEWTSVTAALIIVGTLCPSLVLVAWRRLRHLDRYIGEMDKEIAASRVPMFQPLPLPAIEQLARGLEPVPCARRSGRISTGDPGDRFYVIEAGAADVIGDDRLLTTLGPGDGFGRSRCCAACRVRPWFGRRPTSSCTL